MFAMNREARRWPHLAPATLNFVAAMPHSDVRLEGADNPSSLAFTIAPGGTLVVSLLPGGWAVLAGWTIRRRAPSSSSLPDGADSAPAEAISSVRPRACPWGR